MQASTDDTVSRLEKRKHVVVTTLAYIEQEQSEVERNIEWKDTSTQKRRYALLAVLCSWYEGELKQIAQRLKLTTVGPQ